MGHLPEFDNEPQESYDIPVFTDALHKRITKRARYPKLQGVSPETF